MLSALRLGALVLAGLAVGMAALSCLVVVIDGVASSRMHYARPAPPRDAVFHPPAPSFGDGTGFGMQGADGTADNDGNDNFDDAAAADGDGDENVGDAPALPGNRAAEPSRFPEPPRTAPPASSAADRAELAAQLKRRPVFYPLDAGGWQHLEYVLALRDWTGGLVGLPSDRPGFAELDEFLRAHGVETVLEPAMSVAARMRGGNYASVLLHEGFPPGPHTGRLWHGVGEKEVLTGRRPPAGSDLYATLGPLNLARHLRNSTYYTPGEVRRALGVPEGRRVVLFLLTWADHSMLKERGSEVLEAMRRLGERYHVLVKPHPLLIGGGARWHPPPAAAKIAGVATIVPYTYFNLATVLQLADIVLGEVSGSTVVAPYWSSRPLVYMRHAKYHRVAEKHRGELLGWDEAQILDENNITRLAETVQSTLENGEPLAVEREAARRAYYERKNGVHRDAEVGLRHALHVLRQANGAV